MINDIQLACPDLLCIIFADDDTSLAEDSTLEGVIKKANLGLEKLVNWYSANLFAIHPGKSKCMLFQNKKRHNPSQLTNNNALVVNEDIIVNNVALPIVINLNNVGENISNKISFITQVPNSEEHSIKVLGILLDDKLTFKDHIDYIYSKISRSLYTLKQMRNILDCHHLKLLFSAYLKSHLDYADIFYCLCNKRTLNPLTLLYTKAIRVLSGAAYLDHTKPLFLENKILRINENSEFNILKLMFRCDRGNLPHCLKSYWRKCMSVSGRESRNGDKFYQEKINFNYLANCPYFCYPKLYNNLPEEFRLLTEEKEFAKKVKEYLFDRYEEED